MATTGLPLELEKMASDGERLASHKFNANMESINTFAGEGVSIGARAYHNANQSIANAAYTVLAFNQERWDTDTIHDNATNNSRLTCKTAGKYLIIGQVRFALNATGIREVIITNQAGATIEAVSENSPSGANVVNMLVSTVWDMAVNDYVQLSVFQNSGGALNVDAASPYSPEFMMVKVA